MNTNASEIIYFDNAATTATDKEAAETALKMMTECYANPSSAHSFGFLAEGFVKQARDKIVKALGFKNTDGTLIFTAGGTEADNMAIRGAVKTLARKGKHIVISDSEHPAVESTVIDCGDAIVQHHRFQRMAIQKSLPGNCGKSFRYGDGEQCAAVKGGIS